MKRLIILRRSSQIFFLGLFIYILWSTTYPLKGLFSPEILFKIDPLIMVMTALSERVLFPGLWFSFVMIALTLVVGRFFCGWLCPLGTMIDAVGTLKKRAKILSDVQNKKVRRVKFFVLGAIVLSALLGIQAAWVLDPMVIMARVVSLDLIPAVTLSIDSVFVGVIKKFELYGPVYDFYRALKANFLGINVHFFLNSGAAVVVLLLVAFLSLIFSRFWCRAICPLGALYSLAARFSFLERKIEECIQCNACQSRCRTGAIIELPLGKGKLNKEDASYLKGECILCMDCVYDCPAQITSFSWRGAQEKKVLPEAPLKGISRKEFLFLIFSSLVWAGFKKQANPLAPEDVNMIRPPAALPEKQFLNTCVRCGNCMKVCITNGLQPVVWKAGLQGLWTPELVPEIGYCEYNCTLCGNVCPTGAIPKLSLETKRATKLGLAAIDKSLCIPWIENKNCLVCQEHCPVSEKAIRLQEVTNSGVRILRPYVDETLCVGCGICQNKCPVRPTRAIRVAGFKR